MVAKVASLGSEMLVAPATTCAGEGTLHGQLPDGALHEGVGSEGGGINGHAALRAAARLLQPSLQAAAARQVTAAEVRRVACGGQTDGTRELLECRRVSKPIGVVGTRLEQRGELK